MSPSQLEHFCSEVLDGQSVTLTCGEHGYVGGKQYPPTARCKRCWLVYFVTLYARTPPHKRQEALEHLEQVTHHLAEDLEHNDKAFQLVGTPEFSIEKNVSDEDIEKEKTKTLIEVE